MGACAETPHRQSLFVPVDKGVAGGGGPGIMCFPAGRRGSWWQAPHTLAAQSSGFQVAHRDMRPHTHMHAGTHTRAYKCTHGLQLGTQARGHRRFLGLW